MDGMPTVDDESASGEPTEGWRRHVVSCLFLLAQAWLSLLSFARWPVITCSFRNMEAVFDDLDDGIVHEGVN